MVTYPLEDIIKLIEQGERFTAQAMLEQILASEPHNLSAWAWYVKTYTTAKERIKALELCAQHNPENDQVKQALEKLRARGNKITIIENNNTVNNVLFKFVLISGTIAIAMVVAAFVTYPMAILLPYFGILFPSGLTYSIQVILASITGQNIGPDKAGNFIVGWLIYLGISIPAIMTQKWVIFFILYTILIVLLITNIAGCQASINPELGHSW